MSNDVEKEKVKAIYYSFDNHNIVVTWDEDDEFAGAKLQLQGVIDYCFIDVGDVESLKKLCQAVLNDLKGIDRE